MQKMTSAHLEFVRYTTKFAPLVGVLVVLSACSQHTASVPATGEARRVTVMAEETSKKFPAVPQVNVEELVAMQRENRVLLVDVRTAAERAVSSIPGSIALDEFEANEANHAGTRVVTYCTIGYRSSEYAGTLRREGFDASNLEGSILAWVHAGQPLNDPEGRPTKRVHTYGPRWALLPDGYEAVY